MVDRAWTVDSLKSWVSEVIEAFGPGRVFFGSNYPMDAIASSYPDLVGAFRALVAGYSPTEQRLMLGGNVARLYRLEVGA